MRRLVVLSTVLLLAVGMLGMSLTHAYTPPPGVLGPEDVDFGGETVTFWNWGIHYFASRFDTGGLAPGRLDEAEELFNVKIAWEQRNPWAELGPVTMQRALSGDATHDWVRVQNLFAVWPLMLEGFLYPIGEMLPPEYYEQLYPQDRGSIEGMSYKGQTYGFGSTYGQWSRMVQVAVFNENIFEEAGLPIPYELYDEGNWNWDTVTDLAVQLTLDTNGDGNIDQWGIGTDDIVVTTINIAMANGAAVTRLDDEGYPVFAFDEPQAIEALEQMARWNELGVINHHMTFDRGDAAMGLAKFMGRLPQFHDRLPDGTVTGVLPIPWGPSSTRDVFPVQALETHVLPVTVEDPEAMMALHSFLWRAEDNLAFEDYLVRGDGIEGRDIASTRQASENVLKANEGIDGTVFQLQGIFRSYTNFHQTVGQVINGEKGAASAMAEIKPEIQAILDEMFRN